jgi:hypothetical protein
MEGESYKPDLTLFTLSHPPAQKRGEQAQQEEKHKDHRRRLSAPARAADNFANLFR